MVIMKMDEVIIKAPDGTQIDVDKTSTYAFLARKLAEILEENVIITIDYCMNSVTLAKLSDYNKCIAMNISHDGEELIRTVTSAIRKYKDFMKEE